MRQGKAVEAAFWKGEEPGGRGGHSPEESGDAMSWNRKESPIAVYVDDDTVPRSVPKGRVLMHNHLLPDVDTPSGTNGFLGWTEPEPPPGFVHGLPHYARADVAITR